MHTYVHSQGMSLQKVELLDSMQIIPGAARQATTEKKEDLINDTW